MNAQQLRNSILQQAIQGKLVPQDPADEPASVLLQRIRKEKERLVKEGKLKKKDLERKPIEEDEIPFEIPPGWEWCRVQDISQSYIGLTYKPSEVNEKGTVVLRSSNIKNGKLVLNDVVRVSTKITEKLWVKENDILICARNGSKKLVGKSAIITGIHEPMTFGAFMAICKTPLFSFVYVFLQSDLFFSQLREVSGTTTINQLTQNNLNSFLIPIPPLAEQRRIVAKIEELMPLVERYGKAQDELNKLNESLPARLRQSILQEAIQGRLVLQDPKEEPASELLKRIRKEKEQLVKEGKLKKKDLESKPIEEEEIPFEIPESWAWCRHNQLFEISGGSQPPKSHFSMAGRDGYVRLYQIRDYGEKPVPVFIPMSEANKMTKKGDILLARYGGSLGKVFFAEEGAYNVAMAKVECLFNKDCIDHKYLYWFYHCRLYQDLVKKNNRSAQGGFNKEDLNSLLFPLPPLSEQKRIVAKIEELFGVIKK
jgi:type I restriction enzyme S subunit